MKTADAKQYNYLCESLRGDHDFGSENRLTQVFSAAFNVSTKFRQYFLAFVHHKPLYGATAETQISFLQREQRRPDICIRTARTIKVVIENKVDSPLTVRQLRSYSGINGLRHARKIAMVKHFFEPFSTVKDWSIYHWGDFYRFLEARIRHIQPDQTDYFIIRNFLNYLETVGMKTPTRITKAELQMLAKAIFQLRNSKSPSFSLKKPVFEIANKYVDMLESVVNLLRTEKAKTVRSRLGKAYRFNPSISNWYVDDSEKKHMRVCLSTEIRLKKKIHGRRLIATGLFFNNKSPTQYEFITYAQKDGPEFGPERRYRTKDLILDNYAKHVLGVWKKWLR